MDEGRMIDRSCHLHIILCHFIMFLYYGFILLLLNLMDPSNEYFMLMNLSSTNGIIMCSHFHIIIAHHCNIKMNLTNNKSC